MTPIPPVDELKQQAKRLRQAMADHGTPLPHSAALEILAQQHGVRDWNTISALAGQSNEPQSPSFNTGDRVKGRYLNQPFEGKILSLSTLPGGEFYKITIEFDEPVDVVTFESFSAFRRRINAQVDTKGVSPRKTSNGVPHLVLDV